MNRLYEIIEKIVLFFVEVLFKITKKELTPEIKKGVMEFVKFGIVGLSNTLISYFIYLIVLNTLDSLGIFVQFDYFIANIVAFVLSVLWSFYWNNKYVFKVEDGKERNIVSALIKTYMSYAFTGLLLNNVLAYVWIDMLSINKNVAPLITLIISVPINFVMNKLWAFKSR